MTATTTPRKRRAQAPADAAVQPLADRILAAIADARSRQPANADDVLAIIGGEPAAFWQTLEQLKGECRINAAIIRRATDAKEWMAIWPTGTPVAHRTWKDLNAAGAFCTRPAGDGRQHMPFRRDPERDPRPDLRQVTAKAAGKQTQIHGPERRDRIAALAARRTLEHGITFAEVAADLGISVEGVRYLTRQMVGGSRIAVGKRPGEFAHRIYDPSAQPQPAPQRNADPAADEAPARSGEPTESELMTIADALDAMDLAHDAHTPQAQDAEPAPEPCGAVPVCDPIATGLGAIADALGDMIPDDAAPTAAPDLGHSLARHAGRMSFALWDDGGLSIYDGDDLLQLPPADTARLARLLGVPGNAVPTQEQRA